MKSDNLYNPWEPGMLEYYKTDGFNEAVKERKNKGLTSETTFIGINSADIKKYSQINNLF